MNELFSPSYFGVDIRWNLTHIWLLLIAIILLIVCKFVENRIHKIIIIFTSYALIGAFIILRLL